jgi:hypothetical protein
MALIVAGSIDLSKIDKSRIVEGKNGSKYYNIIINIADEKDQYGNDTSITTGQTKEERENKEKRQFIGNGKIIWSGEKKSTPAPQSAPSKSNYSNNNDLPF